MSRRADREYRHWVATRPLHIQDAIRKYPPGSTYVHQGDTLYLLGYNEQRDSTEVMLIFSRVNPVDDYAAAQRAENRVYICAHHIPPICVH